MKPILFSLIAFVSLIINAYAGDRPNLVIIVSDDVGYSDLGYLGGKGTPSIDALAKGGVRFTQFYGEPLCSPARAAILTGRYPERTKILTALPYDATYGLDPATNTLAKMLHSAGYTTKLVGKWHLGQLPEFVPTTQFDSFFGGLDGQYFGQLAHQYHRVKDGTVDWWDGTTRSTVVEYDTTAETWEALAFVKSAKRPFFLYLAWHAVHVPIEAPDGTANYRAMLAAMDAWVGKVLANVPKNSIVVFLSDNGGAADHNDGLRAGKGSLYEGGIRVPAIISWNGHLPRRDVDVISHDIDIMPTVADLLGLPAPPLMDGISLVPALEGTTTLPPRMLFWSSDGPVPVVPPRFYAVRNGEMKLILNPDDVAELYDVVSDAGEQHDLAAARPDVVAEMRTALAAWRADVGL